MKTLQETITELTESVLSDDNLLVVDVDVNVGGKQTIISVFLDTIEGGLNIDQCAKISRELSFLIDAQEIVTDKFTLNVSSPGLDRPLKDERQYAKNVNRKASVKFMKDGEKKSLKGVFVGFDTDHIKIDLGKGEILPVNRAELLELKILPAF